MPESPLSMFGENIFMLIGLLIAAACALALLIAAWTAVKVWWWKRGERRAQQDYHRGRVAPDGSRLPPLSRGICAACGCACDEVVNLPTGERLCRRHYAARTSTARGDHPRHAGEA